jgi:acyl carrier protein
MQKSDGRDEQIRCSVREEIEQLLAEKGHAQVAISEDHHLEADLGLGSLDLVNLLTIIDTRLGRNSFAARSDPAHMKTVRDLYNAYTLQTCDATCSSPDVDLFLRAAKARGMSRRQLKDPRAT